MHSESRGCPLSFSVCWRETQGPKTPPKRQYLNNAPGEIECVRFLLAKSNVPFFLAGASRGGRSNAKAWVQCTTSSVIPVDGYWLRMYQLLAVIVTLCRVLTYGIWHVPFSGLDQKTSGRGCSGAPQQLNF